MKSDTRAKDGDNGIGPNVFIPGFPRCGSTFLYLILKQHPDVFIPKYKEVHYFNKYWYYLTCPSKINPNFKKGLKWYTDQFDPKKKVRMDFSICTSFDLDSAKRVKRGFPDAKIILMTRDKERHQRSMYKILYANGDIPNISYEKYRRKYKYVLELSNFEKYSAPWKKLFSHVLIVSLEDIEKRPKKTVKKILNFLNLREHNFDYNMYRHSLSDKKYSYKRRIMKKIALALHSLGMTRIFHFLYRDRFLRRKLHMEDSER